MTDPILCPSCNYPMKLHKRKLGMYRLYICADCKACDGTVMKALQIRNRNYKCPEFEKCMVENLGSKKCKGCEKNAL